MYVYLYDVYVYVYVYDVGKQETPIDMNNMGVSICQLPQLMLSVYYPESMERMEASDTDHVYRYLIYYQIINMHIDDQQGILHFGSLEGGRCWIKIHIVRDLHYLPSYFHVFYHRQNSAITNCYIHVFKLFLLYRRAQQFVDQIFIFNHHSYHLQYQLTMGKVCSRCDYQHHKQQSPQKPIQQHLRDGHVKKVFKDGQVYQGQLLNGKINGKGRYTHRNGDVYEGQFQDNKAHGYGIYYKKEGGKIQGTWEQNYIQGFATETWQNGNKYTGNFVKGIREGGGQFSWSDGRTYSGKWKKNVRDGKGILFWPDGMRYEGEWQDDKMNGIAKLTKPNGKTLQGIWNNDQYIGGI